MFEFVLCAILVMIVPLLWLIWQALDSIADSMFHIWTFMQKRYDRREL